MKSLLCFCALLLVIGVAAPAHAYRISVLDPPAGQSITSQPFSVTFSPCSSNPANGCFYGQNDTGSPLTTLEIYFPNTGVLANQPLGCPTTNPQSIFQLSQCVVMGGYQIFFFSIGTIGTIPPASDFLIFEEGLSPLDSNGNPVFPTGTSFSPTALTVPSAVPEPNSIALLSTALLIGGFFVAKKRDLMPAALMGRSVSR